MDEVWEVSEARGANSEAPHLWEGLVCAWPMLEQGGTTIWDVSGYQHHAQTFNMDLSQSWRLRPDGPGLWADGINDYAQANLNYPLLRFSKAHTFLWYGDLGTSGGVSSSLLVGKTGAVWNSASGGLQYSSNQRLFGTWAIGIGSTRSVLSVVTPSTPRADHIVCTYEPSIAVRLYFNGKEVASNTTSVPSTFWNDNNFPYTLFAAASVSNFISCTCLQVAMWSRALRSREVSELASDPWAMYRVRPRALVRGVTLKKTPIHHLIAACV
jgi:hypothetical protein